ncbi:MAG TPA: CaiB/BaiF CoA-transferase family protein [Micromonosporaceae bacterium]|nr:CaiB/BaiF CoA-transferase family protein [Micromonosporaceae bacterium]
MIERTGPLSGVRVIELAGIGPGPYTGMLLADLGAEVIRVERPGGNFSVGPHHFLSRGRRSVSVNLKTTGAADVVLRLVSRAEALIEGFRPGVAERLGVGPERCHAVNPRLVYGRMTGWGQDGPLASRAGHDITYLALSGALRSFGPSDAPPMPPLNLLGDFGGGGMMLAFGVVAGLFEAQRSGRGQVVDAAILDGTVSMMGMLLGMRALGLWSDERGGNLFDGGAPFYAVYQCADGEYVAVGALEEQFYANFVTRLRTGPEDEPPTRNDPANWPALREWIGSRFAARTRDEWAEVFSGTDACVAPVLSVVEAAKHPHVQARGSYLHEGEVLAPAPVPRFDRTPGVAGALAPEVGADTVSVLTDVGYSGEEIAALLEAGVVATND